MAKHGPTSARLFDVVVVGGSYAGLALARALACAGGPHVSIAVVEHRDLGEAGLAVPDPRAFAIAAGSRQMLEAIAVWPDVAAAAEPVLGIDITDSRLEDAVRPVLLSYDNTVAGMAQTHIVEARRLGDALLASVRRTPSVTIMAPATVRDMAGGPSEVILMLEDGGAIRARLAVAADGIRSRLREAAGIGVLVTGYEQSGIVTTVRHEAPHEGRAVQHFLPGGPFAMLPLSGHRSCVTWSEDATRAQQILGLDDAAFLAEIQQRAGWERGALSLAGQRAAWPLWSRMARALAGRRLALVGDAARSVHPIAGQGLNLGFRDVSALVEALVVGLRLGLDPGDPTILNNYARWRRFDGLQADAAFSGLNAVFSNDAMVLRGMRDIGLGLVDRLPGLKQWLVSEAAGLTGEVPRLLRGELP